MAEYKMNNQENFPDGTPIDGWFYETHAPQIEKLGKQYILTDYIKESENNISLSFGLRYEYVLIAVYPPSEVITLCSSDRIRCVLNAMSAVFASIRF